MTNEMELKDLMFKDLRCLSYHNILRELVTMLLFAHMTCVLMLIKYGMLHG